jgi:hypothetical protein
MRETDHLIDPILKIANGGLRRRPTPRYSEMEIRRRVAQSRDRLDELLRVATTANRTSSRDLLLRSAELLPDGRIAISRDALRQLLDQVSSAQIDGLLEALLTIAFGDDAASSA